MVIISVLWEDLKKKLSKYELFRYIFKNCQIMMFSSHLYSSNILIFPGRSRSAMRSPGEEA